MSSDRVRAVLRAKAAAYQPDRTAILGRIQHGQAMAEPARTPRAGHRRTAVRTVGIAATVAAVLGSSVAVTWAAIGADVLRTSAPEPVVTPAPASRSPRATHGPVTTSRSPSATHAPSHSSPSPAAPSSASPSPVAPSSAKADQQGFLRANGVIDAHSIDNWAQSNVTVVTSETLTALEVSVRVVATPDLSSTGAWSSIPSEKLVTTIEQQPDALVYRFTLKPGADVRPGSYIFAEQYGHAVGGRDASRDTYRAVATAGGPPAEVGGGF